MIQLACHFSDHQVKGMPLFGGFTVYPAMNIGPSTESHSGHKQVIQTAVCSVLLNQGQGDYHLAFSGTQIADTCLDQKEEKLL